MGKEQLSQLFLNDLRTLYSAENQLIESLPRFISASSSPELSEALQEHWEDLKDQISRLDRIFEILKKNPEENLCQPMEALILQAQQAIDSFAPSFAADANLINIMQCIEHYEIALYSTLRTVARQLGYNDIAEVLQQGLEDENSAYMALTNLAESGFFTVGINHG